MDFMQKGHPGQTVNGSPSPVEHSGSHRRKKAVGILGYFSMILLISAMVLVVAILVSVVLNKPKNEDKYIDGSKLQAVFLNNGQVYFGNIASLNDKYLRLQNIYYLRVNQTVQPKQTTSNQSNDVSLAKLGCELHGPEDQMIINRPQVTFWENLKTDGQVSKAVAAFVKANPNGQTCTNTSTTPSSSSNSSSSQ